MVKKEEDHSGTGYEDRQYPFAYNMQDKVWVVIIHCVHAMQHVPRGLSSVVCRNPV